MKRSIYYILSISILAVALIISIFNNLSSKKEKRELETLLIKSTYSIDRDNKNIHDDLWEILNNESLAKSRPYLPIAKAYFDSMEISLATKDSSYLIKNLTTEITNKLNFNDSLIQFRSNWTNDGVIDHSYLMFETFEHKPIYKYGDTAILIFTLVNTLGLQANANDIIGFSPKEIGTQSGNTLRFIIPTGKLFKSISKAIEYTFDYKYILRNNYTNKYDTSYLSKTFTIIP